LLKRNFEHVEVAIRRLNSEGKLAELPNLRGLGNLNNRTGRAPRHDPRRTGAGGTKDDQEQQ
jgi:hypothetical protein